MIKLLGHFERQFDLRPALKVTVLKKLGNPLAAQLE